MILDDAQGTVAAAFGLSAYPYFVFVDADGQVALRATGACPPPRSSRSSPNW